MSEEKKPFGVKAEEIPMILVDKGCGRCFGRGFTGRYADGSVKPCVCALVVAADKVSGKERGQA